MMHAFPRDTIFRLPRSSRLINFKKAASLASRNADQRRSLEFLIFGIYFRRWFLRRLIEFPIHSICIDAIPKSLLPFEIFLNLYFASTRYAAIHTTKFFSDMPATPATPMPATRQSALRRFAGSQPAGKRGDAGYHRFQRWFRHWLWSSDDGERMNGRHFSTAVLALLPCHFARPFPFASHSQYVHRRMTFLLILDGPLWLLHPILFTRSPLKGNMRSATFDKYATIHNDSAATALKYLLHRGLSVRP